jgi:hypothetical protein
MGKKVEVIVDVKSEEVNITSDRVLTLSEQLRILKKEIQKAGPGPEQDLLIGKFNDISDELDKTNLKSKEFLGALGSLPGPVGMFAGSLDGAVNMLRNFTSFSFKDIKTQLGGLGADFGKIFKNIGDLTGISKLYAASNVLVSNSLKAVGISASTSSKGVNLFSKALIATGIGALVIALGLLIANFDKVKKVVLNLIPGLAKVGDVISGLVDTFTDFIGVTNESERAEAKRQATFAKAKANTDIVNQGIQREINLLKAKGATQEEIDKKEKQIIQNQITDLRKATDAKGMLYGEQATEYKDLVNKLAVIDETAKTTQREKDKKAGEDKTAKNKQTNDQITADTKTASDMLLKLQQDNSALIIEDERKRQDQELKNQKKDEEAKINALKLKDTVINGEVVKAEELKRRLLEQVGIKYTAKQTEVDNKRKEDDKKKEEEFNKKIEEIRISALETELERTKQARKNKYDQDLKDLEADKLFIAKSEEDKAKIRKNLLTAYNNEINKITLEDKLKKEAVEKGDYDAKFARTMAGVTNDLDQQRKLLEQKKINDEQYYTKQLARENLTTEQIRELNDRKLADQLSYTEKSNQIERDRISVKQKALDDIISIAGAESDVGRAALIAKQLLMAKELVMEVSKTITFSTQAAARSVVAVAEGTAQTAKIGFPQNIPMLIGYAAQAVAIISAIMSAVNSAKSSKASSETGSAPAPPNYGKGYAEGGLLEGPRHAQGGMLINAEGGEAVMTRGAVTMFAPMLSMMNQMGGGTAFTTGVSGQANYDQPKSTQNQGSLNTTIMKTYVVSSEMTSDQEKQARLKDLSTL